MFHFLSLNPDEKAIKPCTEIGLGGGGVQCPILGYYQDFLLATYVLATSAQSTNRWTAVFDDFPFTGLSGLARAAVSKNRFVSVGSRCAEAAAGRNLGTGPRHSTQNRFNEFSIVVVWKGSRVKCYIKLPQFI